MTNLSRGTSLFAVLIVYLAAFFAGLFSYRLFSGTSLLAFFIADIIATLVVWFFGLLFKNASMYDPYWSVAPIVFFVSFISITARIDAFNLLYLFVFIFWGTRLTLNWIIGWRGMRHQDWRYTMLRKKNEKLWILTNLFGINMIPTFFVFAAMVPAYFAAMSVNSINIITILGALICVSAVILQIISDSQILKFRKDDTNKGKYIQTGLWKYSRHPNYLGEVCFWWGIWIIQISVLPGLWWTIFAPVLMTMLFVFISIPMMEKRLLVSKEGYNQYKKSTSMLILLPKK